jgi:transposase InsO family protein
VRHLMGRRATCFDNAVSESFFATYKKELIHTRPWNDLTEKRQHTFLWIESYYNHRRRHSTHGILDTQRTRARIPETNRSGSLNRCQ